MTVWANVVWAILSIVTKIVTLKALGEGGHRTTMDGDLDNSSGGEKDPCPVGGRLEKSLVKSEDLLINSSIFQLRFYSSGRRHSSGRRGRGESG